MRRRPVRARVGDLWHARDGKLTQLLERAPGGFGLGQVPRARVPDSTTTVVCGFCSTGCALTAHLRNGSAVNLTPAVDYSVNRGMACPKGWEALTPLAAPDRATMPLLRNSSGAFEEVRWPTALDRLVRRFQGIQAEHGPASVAFIGTGQMPIEELAFFGALAKFGMGMIHGDANTRQCMATAVTAYKETFGFDAPPYTYADLEESDLLVFVGANPCIAHPILWERVVRNQRQPEVVVIDPRRTETAQAASRHVALRPQSDLELFYSIAHVLVREAWIDRAFIDAHTTGFEAFAAHVAAFAPAVVADRCGVPALDIEHLARLIHTRERVSFWWTMGVNQSHQGVRTAQALIALALLTGNIGKPGTGANSITGQCNAMGSRLFSNTTSLIGGHAWDDPAARAKVSRVLGIDEARIQPRMGLLYDQIFEAIARGDVRGLWIAGTNPAHSWINQRDARELLSRLDFLVVQDMYTTTDTAKLAHLVLPAAGWGEKDGVFINSERRLGMIKQVRRAPGQALSDFRIFQLVADAWGCGEMFARWRTPEAVFGMLKDLTRGQPCDITGVGSYQELDADGGVQWPVPAGTHVARGAERRLFEDGAFFTPDRRARFVFEAPRPPAETVRTPYPFTLLTGRGSASQWHTETRTSKSEVLRRLAPAAEHVEINPDDAALLGIGPTDWVRVSSRRGSVELRAFLTRAVPRGSVFAAMHTVKTNVLTFASFDPYSRQPAYKHCAVALEKIDAPSA
ncbi:MAG TPA: molybdopterin oxidoreductase family protein [Kofleriaceae bacterium]|nr:molybdopterin oxidoreductase family protein [Kofleriaceae bacterium]